MNAVVAEEERKLSEHLGRASELLRADKLLEAEAEIGAALSLRPDDLRARNLRGLLLFRAGRYEEARAGYIELAGRFPDDAAIRLNLGLVELRMGRHTEAVQNLTRVISTEPENARAQGYLGLALMRTGNLSGARDAFIKGGQGELAKQVEERMAQAEEAMAARSDLRRAAQEGERALDREQPFGSVELETPEAEAKRGGSWQLRVPGERPPLPGPEGSDTSALPLLLSPPKPVATYATGRLLRPGGPGEPFSMAEGGTLLVRVDGRLPTRTWGAIASTGALTFEPLQRRVRGHAVEETFGEGGEAMFVAVGNGLMVVSPRGGHFQLLALADDIVYVREPSVYAFEETLHWENGRVPGGGSEGLRVVQFRGNGRMVVRAQRPTYTLKIEPEAPLLVVSSTVLGWIGRVVPRIMHGDDGAISPYIEASGEGVLILEEPPAL
jgi:tetratricopeptide (TPR) repeat protein